MQKIRWFQLSVIASFIAFCGIMLYVVIVVSQRNATGSLGIDASKLQQMRIEANRSHRDH